MRIVQVIRGFAADGPGRLVLALLRSLEAKDACVSLFALSGAGGLRHAMAAEAERLGGQVCVRETSWSGVRRASAALAAFARHADADCLHAHLLRPDVVARRAALGAGLPLVTTEHGVHAWREGGLLAAPFVARWYRRTMPPRFRIAAISAKVARDLARKGLPEERVSVVQNGVEWDRFAIPSAGERQAARSQLRAAAPPVFLVLGNLIARKAPGLALEAFAELHALGVRGTLLFAGDGPLKGALERRAEKLGLAGSVRLPGKIEDPRLALAAADVLLHPAEDEPFGLAVAEALACGIPVLARAGSGADELSAHVRCVEGEDAGAWARALRELAQSHATAEAIRASARGLTAERMARDYLALYRETALETDLSPAESEHKMFR